MSDELPPIRLVGKKGAYAKVLAAVVREATKLGATVEDHTGYRHDEFQVAAPDGKVWSCMGDIHWLVFSWHVDERGRPTWPEERDSAIADVLDRMTYGIDDCPDPECEVCHPLPED